LPDLDPEGAYELDPRVALRPEPFGALAYHYGNRRLTFLRSARLVELVRSLAGHPSLDSALTAAAWPATGRTQALTALGRLLDSGVIRAR